MTAGEGGRLYADKGTAVYILYAGLFNSQNGIALPNSGAKKQNARTYIKRYMNVTDI